MNPSLIDFSLTLFKSTFTTEYKLVRTGNYKQTFQVCAQWFLDKDTRNKKIGHTTNKEAMKSQWNPVGGFETLVAQLTKGLIFAQYAGAPISIIDVVGMGFGNVLMTGLFAEEYKILCHWIPTEKSFAHFKTLWSEQVCIKEFTTMTAGQMNFGINSQEEEVDEEYDNEFNNMAQAHLAQYMAMRNMSNSNEKMDSIQQQLNLMT